MFNWKVYKELNPELSSILKSPIDYINHYNKQGKKKRIYWNCKSIIP
jgi:hypothetical protein